MLPPGTHKYFFSIANKPVVAQDESSQANNPSKAAPKIPKLTLDIPKPSKESISNR